MSWLVAKTDLGTRKVPPFGLMVGAMVKMAKLTRITKGIRAGTTTDVIDAVKVRLSLNF
jgi:hypothetical protein